MFRLVCAALLFFIGRQTSAQYIPDFGQLPTAIDSIRFQVEKNVTIEMTLEGQSTVHEEIGSVILSNQDGTKFLKNLHKKASYTKGRALLTHYNLRFTCYSSDINSLHVDISTLTRNIDIRYNNESSFYGKISSKMGKYLIKLLVQYGWYETVAEFGDLEGIE